MRNKPVSETELEEIAREAIRSRLPATWDFSLETQTAGPSPKRSATRPDAIIEIASPDGRKARLIVEFKSGVEAKDVPALLRTLGSERSGTPLVVAPFLGARARERLVDLGAGYVDSTGNIRLALEDPAVYIEDSGAQSNPWREERPLRSLKGPAASRVVRALCDFRPPYGIRELAERSSTPVATVARVVGLLDRDALLERTPRGPVTSVDWAGVLRRWTQDYAFNGSNRTLAFLDPRGGSALLKTLRRETSQYAVTGSFASAQVRAVAPPRIAAIFVPSISKASKRFELRPAETGANVLLAEPYDRVVFERTWSRDHVTYTAFSQIAADLLTGPGRAPSEAEELMRWMAENEDAWRTKP